MRPDADFVDSETGGGIKLEINGVAAEERPAERPGCCRCEIGGWL